MTGKSFLNDRSIFYSSKVVFTFGDSIKEKLSSNYFIFRCQVVTNCKISDDDSAKIRI